MKDELVRVEKRAMSIICPGLPYQETIELVNIGRDPLNQNFRKFRSKTQWIGLVQPEKFRKNWSIF